MDVTLRSFVLLAALLSPTLALAQAAVAPGSPLPGLGSPGGPGTASEDSGGKVANTKGTGPGKPNFKELRLDAQTGGVNSYVRVGPSLNGQGQNQNASGTTGSGQRTGGELFKIGGNIKF